MRQSRVRFPLALAGALFLAACAGPENLQNLDQGYGFGDNLPEAETASPYLPTGTNAYGQPVAVTSAPATASSTVPGASGLSSADINSVLYGTAAQAPVVAPAPPATGVTAPGTFAPLDPAASSVAVTAPAAAPATEGVAIDPSATTPATAAMSDEQDFQAVTARETIESDKARLEANKAQYQEIAPTALPERPSDDAASPVIAYVASTQNRLGQPNYTRRTVSEESHQKACQRYATAAAAMEAFLKSGGPERDPKKLDPDGDGFACDFDPRPFHKAVAN